MSKLITRIKRLALALCLATPIVSWADGMEFTDPTYTPWDGVYGAVAWRSDGGNFEVSKVADIAADGTIGDAYAMKWDTAVATSGRRFCSACTSTSWYPGYTPPGMLLVYDQTGKAAAANATFSPLSFCGMWVKALADETTPYSVTGSGNRITEFGVAGVSSYFKFDKSFTVNRTGTTTFLGDATVEIAQEATFTAQANASYDVAVDSAATLKLEGSGTLAVTTMTVNGTLDLSAETVPTISGNVTLVGTIVLPEGTDVSQEPFKVCTGTLSSGNVFVKIGDAEAVEKSFTAENGAITSFGDPIYIFTENYPTAVPAGKTYTFIGGDTADNTVVVDALNVYGTLKTQGYFSFTNYKSNGSTLDVESGSLTLSPGNNWFNGTLTVEAGATFVNALASDAVQYGGTFTANIYGTLDMGATRWSLGSNNTLNFYEGCTVTGSGQSGNGTFDWIENANATINVYGDVNLAAPIRVRATATVNVNVDTTDQKGLTLAGTIGGGKIVKKGAGLVKFTTNPPYAITVENGAFTFAVDATPTITYSAKPGTGTAMSMWYATQATWKGTVVLGVLSAPTALPLDTYGNANSKIVLTGTTGNCYLNGTTTVAAEVVVGTNENSVVEFNNGNSNQVGTFSKVSGPGTLKLVGWTGCSAATYVLSTLDNFEGLAIANNITRDGGGTFTIRIGNIVTTRTTNPGDCVLPIANTALDNATGTVVYDLANATLNGEAADLEVKENGIYVAEPAPTTVTIAITPVSGATVSAITVNGQGEEVADSITVDIGATVSVTYTANEGYVVTGSPVEFTATAETTFVDVSGISADAILATITSADGETVTPYTSVATAFTEVDDDETLTLVGTAVTLATDVTVEKSYTLAGDAEGTAVTGAGKIYLTGSAELTLDATLTSVGNQFWFSSKDAKLTFPTAGFTPNVRPYTAGGCQTGTTVNGDGTTTFYQYLFLTLQVGASNVTLAYADTEDPLATKQVYEGDEIVFTATPAEGYENVVVTANSEALTPVDGKYTVVIGTVNVAIQATASIKQVTLTLPEVANATAAVTVDSVAQTAPYTFDYGTEVTVTWTADANYEITEGAVENITLTADTEAAAPTVVVTKYTVTVPIVEHTAITVTEGGVTVEGAEDGEGNMVYLVTPASKVVVKYTAVGEWVASKTKTISSISENTVISGSDVPVPAPAEVEYTNSKSEVSYKLASGLGSIEEGTYKLLTNITRAQRMAYSTWAYSVTIDLNGFTLTSTAPDYAILAGRNGTDAKPRVLNLVDTSAEKGGILLFTTTPSSSTAAISVSGKYNQVTIGEGVTVQGGAIGMFGENQTLTVNGTVNGGDDFAIISNGNDTTNLTLTVASGAVVTSAETAIYLPGTGTATIAGSVTGKTGVEVRSGSLTVVDGATITATGEFSEKKNGGGPTVDGAAVAVSQHTTMNAIDVIVSGGTLTGAKSLYETNIQNGEDTVDITMSVTGGTFNGAVASADVTGFITGGTFDSDPSAYVASGYKATETSTGVWTVTEKKGIDPTDPDSKQDVTVEPTGDDEADKAAAEAQGTVQLLITDTTAIAAMEAIAAADPELADAQAVYNSYFKYTAAQGATAGAWEVTAEIAPAVEAEVNDSAIDELEGTDFKSADEGAVVDIDLTVKPGLYYGVVCGTDLSALGSAPVTLGLATSASKTFQVTKPTGSGTACFIKVVVSATAD